MAEQDSIQVPLLFVGIEDTPALYANHFVLQHQQSEFILTVGQVSAPILLGSEDEQREQAKNISYVPVKVVARFVLTRDRLVELIEVFQKNLQNYDRARGIQ